MTLLNNITTNTAIVFAVAVGLILLYLFFLYGRNPVLVKLGLRNIPRRPTQSILIVIGLALSTIIIVSALSTGDTLSYSLQRQAVAAYGEIDEILAPPLLSLFISLADEQAPDAATGETTDPENADPETATETAAISQNQQQLENLTAGGLTTALTVLDGGLPGITEARYAQLRDEAAADPLIDRVAASILFPTIIRNQTTGQGEPLGFIFAVDSDYDQNFGLTTIEGTPVEMEALQPGVGNIFGQASNLFNMAGELAQGAGLNLQLSDVAVATAAVGAALTGATLTDAGGLGLNGTVDLATISIPLDTIDQLGLDTTPLREQGLTELSLEAFGVNTTTLESDLREVGITTTTLSLDNLGLTGALSGTVNSALSNTLGITSVATLGQDILAALNLNTLSSEIDRVLAQYGLQLRQGDVYLNRLGADQLNARVGDVLDVYIGPIPVPFRVRAIVEEAGPLGALFPVVMLRLDEAQQLLFMQGKVNNVLVSNVGDELGGLVHTEVVSNRLRVLAMDETALERLVAVLRRPDVRDRVIQGANEFVNELDDEFEGPQIIADLIQSVTPVGGMLDAARDLPTELDAPGISTRLREIIGNTTFRALLLDLSIPDEAQAELTAALGDLNTFDVIDPLNKQTLLTVGTVGGSVFTSIFSLFGFFSILAGILLIFLIFVMLATERRSEMGMLRAIGVQRRHLVQMFVVEGMIYDLLAAAIGVLLGLGVTYAMVGFLGDIFNNLAEQISSTSSSIFRFEFRAAPASVVIGYCLGVLLTFLVVTFSAWRVSRLNIVSAIRDLPEDAAEVQRSWLNRIWGWGIGIGLAVAGWYVITFGLDVERLGIVLAGVTFLFLGVMLLIERILILTPVRNETVRRIVYTIIGLGLLALWAVPWPQALPQILPQWADAALLDLGPDQTLVTLALGGPLIILGAILAITFNAGALTWFIGFVLGGVGSLTPVLKTAIAYPLSARFRTGMTMLMFAMIISTVVIMAVVISATQTVVVLDEKETAGFEIRADSTLLSFFSPLRDFNRAVADQQANPDYPMLQAIAAVSSIAEQDLWAKATTQDFWSNVEVAGVDAGYWEQAAQVYSFRQRAPGFADDAAVWAALQTRTDVAIITPNVLITSDSEDTFPFGDGEDGPRRRRFEEDGQYYGPFRLQSAGTSTDPLPELYLDLSTSTDDSTPRQRVQVIAALAENTSLAGTRLQLNRGTLDPINTTAVQPSRFYVKVNEGTDVRAVAQEVERAFIGNGLNVVVLAESFAQGQAFARGILRLFQGFMALGLLVGIAALGVITSRTVVERRQQVGMLRAIGYQSNMVALSFVLEASFIAITGLLIGAVTGIVLGESIVRTFFTALTPGTTFSLPWGQIGLILIGSYLAALLATIVPAYGAARIYPAEALRYE